VRVGAEIVEFFAGTRALHELEGRAGEFSFGHELAHERIDRETFFLVAIERGEGGAGAERADVMVTRVVHGADALFGFVDAIARGERVAAGRGGALADEAMALHQQRARNSRGGERRGGEVEEADQLVVHRAGCVAGGGREIFRPADDQRHAQAAVVTPVDAARLEAAVVAEEDDHSVVFAAFGAEFFEHDAEAFVHAGNGIQVARPFFAHDGMVGVIGRRRDVGGCGDFRVLALADPLGAHVFPRLAVVDVVFGLYRIYDGEEGAVFRQGGPVVGIFVIDGAFVDEVQVEFAGADFFSVEGFEVGGEIAGVAQTVGDGPHAFGQAERVGAMRAHGVRVRGRLIHTDKKRGAAGRAGRIGGDDVRVAHALGRESVEVGRADVFAP
jgi:hypothetical protein